jgi:parallel beta-helix repeat protein
MLLHGVSDRTSLEVCKILLTFASLALAVTPALGETYVPGGNVSGTWTVEGSPYLVQGSISIASGTQLIIEAGVSVQFLGVYSLTVSGVLEAAGTEADSIRFTAVSSWNGVTFNNAVDVSNVSYTSFSGPGVGLLNCDNSSPEISHCRISGCGGVLGGVRAVNSANPNLTHCTISNNARGIWWSSTANGVFSDCVISGNYARGVLVYTASRLTFVGCSFSDNTTSQDGGAAYTTGTRLIFLGCTFTNNETTTSTGRGGAVHCYFAHANFTDCTFRGNYCFYQAGPDGGGAISLYSSDATLTRCALFENTGYWAGGAIAATQNSSYILDHCTVDDNVGDQGILYSDGTSSATIKNSIISNGSGSEEGITAYGALALHYTAFFNNGDGDVNGNIPSGFADLVQTNANGDSCDVYYNIFMDPLYVDQPGRDYHLQAGSPCIDAGDPADPLDPDSTLTDMGAYWYDQRRPQIVLSAEVLDFGIVPAGEMAELPLTISNPGDADLEISAVTCDPACYATDFESSDSPIPPGGELVLIVSFTPPEAGSYPGLLDIVNNDEPAQVDLLGEGNDEGGVPDAVPAAFALQGPWPNPAHPSASLQVALPTAALVRLELFDLTGRCVSVVLKDRKSAGTHTIHFDAGSLPPGLYLYRCQAGDRRLAGKVTILR